MRKWTLLLALTLFPHLAGSGTVASSETAEPPKRINKAIELLERGQPIYYAGAHGGYEEGRKMARTWADYIKLRDGAWILRRDFASEVHAGSGGRRPHAQRPPDACRHLHASRWAGSTRPP